MPTPTASVTSAFERIALGYASDARVSRGRMLVSEGPRINGRFFAALAGESLLVKLPRARVEALVATGIATPFESGNGRVMKEWALVSPAAKRRWPGLADEALAFVE